MGLIDDLERGDGPTGLDTAVFICYIEEHPRYLPLIEPVFAAIDAGRLYAVTSALTLLETLVVPYRAGNQILAHRYETLLRRSKGLHLADIGLSHLRAAALLRATMGCKTPDAIQLAAALAAGCSTFLTNDRRFRAPTGIEILQLDDY